MRWVKSQWQGGAVGRSYKGVAGPWSLVSGLWRDVRAGAGELEKAKEDPWQDLYLAGQNVCGLEEDWDRARAKRVMTRYFVAETH